MGTPLAPPPAFGDLPGANGKVGLCSQGFRQVYNLFLSRQAQEQAFERSAVNSRCWRQVWGGRGTEGAAGPAQGSPPPTAALGTRVGPAGISRGGNVSLQQPGDGRGGAAGSLGFA